MIDYDEDKQEPIYAMQEIEIPTTYKNEIKEYDLVDPYMPGVDKFKLILD
jgi:hypothetical protein